MEGYYAELGLQLGRQRQQLEDMARRSRLVVGGEVSRHPEQAALVNSSLLPATTHDEAARRPSLDRVVTDGLLQGACLLGDRGATTPVKPRLAASPGRAARAPYAEAPSGSTPQQPTERGRRRKQQRKALPGEVMGRQHGHSWRAKRHTHSDRLRATSSASAHVPRAIARSQAAYEAMRARIAEQAKAATIA